MNGLCLPAFFCSKPSQVKLRFKLRKAFSTPSKSWYGGHVASSGLGWVCPNKNRLLWCIILFLLCCKQPVPERNQFKTRPDDASLHPVSQTFFKDSSENVGGVEKHDFRFPLGRETVADGVSFSVGCQEPRVRVWIGFNEEAWKGEFLTCCN